MNPSTFIRERHKLTPQQIAVLKYVWALNAEEKKLLERLFMMQIRAGTLAQVVDTEHEYKDSLIYKGVRYEIIWLQCSIDSLERPENHARKIAISFRFSKTYNIALALIRWPRAGSIMTCVDWNGEQQ